MVGCVRILMIMVLAAFAAGTIVNAANAAAMSQKMTVAAVGGADMGDCQGCPDGNDELPPCDTVCLSPVLAVVPPGQAGLSEARTSIACLVPCGLARRSGPPDPYPPRSITLS